MFLLALNHLQPEKPSHLRNMIGTTGIWPHRSSFPRRILFCSNNAPNATRGEQKYNYYLERHLVYFLLSDTNISAGSRGIKSFPEEYYRPLALHLTFDKVLRIPVMYQFGKYRITIHIVDICLFLFFFLLSS